MSARVNIRSSLLTFADLRLVGMSSRDTYTRNMTVGKAKKTQKTKHLLNI